MRFIASGENLSTSRFAIFGAPYDGTASFRPGTRFGPDAIRAASDGLETYSPLLDADLEDLAFVDLGDLELGFGAASGPIACVKAETKRILEHGAIPFMLGGEHSLTGGAFAAVVEQFSDVALIQIDAHADLRADYLGDPDSHACVMNRCVELGATLFQFGIRSGTRDEWSRMRETETLQAITDFESVLQSITSPIYLTLDLDVFDPSLLPGTGTPEPGGIAWADFEWMVSALKNANSNVVAVDVMELSPQLDPSGVSSVVAAKCVRELLLVL